MFKKLSITPFFPGIKHSQFIKFNDPSGFLVGLAIKPLNDKFCKKNQNNIAIKY
jgi:hypothetical protein